nr:hypothetical protein [Tanacetum cinerariifolium]
MNLRKRKLRILINKIALEKKVKELDNIVCKIGQSAQTVHMFMKPQSFYDNNLKQVLGFQNPFYLKKSQQIRLILYDGSVIAKETITSHPNTDQSASSPVKIEAPRELPKLSLVNTSLKKLKYHLGLDNVVKKQITPDALTEGEWGFEHSKAVFKEIIPFVKTLKDIFNVFDKYLLNKITEVQIVFNQMEATVQQYHVDKQIFEIQKKQFLIENDRLLDQIISQDIVNIVVNFSVDENTCVKVNSSMAIINFVNYVEMCNKCLELKAKLIKQHNMVEKDEYNKLSKIFSKLEQYCISLEITMQLNKEIFQKNNTFVNQTKPSSDQLFELNNLKAELQAKDITIEKLKANIKCLNKTSTTNTMKKDIDEIKTINIELEHREKVFVITTLKNDLRKFKGKDIVENAAQVSNDNIIAPGLYKLDPITLAHKDKNNKETHIYYLKHTMEQATILKEIVEQAYLLNPLDSASYSAYKKKNGNLQEKCLPKLDINGDPHEGILILDGNACPLTMITATNKVPLMEPIPLEVIAQESVVTKAYTRRPKHMTEDRSYLTNFVHKFRGTVKFGNDKIAKIIGQNRTLVEAARTMLIYAKAPLFLWAEAIATKTQSILPIFGALCYPNNDSEDLGKLQAKADIVPVANAPRAVDLADSPVSTSFDQDAPSIRIPSSQE